MDPYYLVLTDDIAGVDLRAAGARHFDHLVEPRHDQHGAGLHLRRRPATARGSPRRISARNAFVVVAGGVITGALRAR